MSTDERTRLYIAALAGGLATLTVAAATAASIFTWLRRQDRRAWQQLAENDARLVDAIRKLAGRRGQKPNERT